MFRPITAAIGLLLLPLSAGAYPGGTPSFVTDVAPYCASCHSSAADGQLVGVAPQRAKSELAAAKHIAKVEEAREGGPYAKLTEEQRAALVEGIRALDAAASVTLLAPDSVKAGSVFEVTLEATGGGGPVVGLALVDSNQRWQARPAASAGWHVIEKPRVIGPDGVEQTKFTDGRNAALAPGVSYVNVSGVSADTAAGKYSRVSVTFRLRAPAQAGSVPLGAAFWYGTEKGSPNGAVETAHGVAPVGGFTGASGRVAFSDVKQITVE